MILLCTQGLGSAEVSKRLGVSLDLLSTWKKRLSLHVFGDDKDAGIRSLKRARTRVTDERNILTGVAVDPFRSGSPVYRHGLGVISQGSRS
jgi:hypothetical protein